MEGWIADWYTTTTRKDLHEFQTLARRITRDVPDGSRILELAPGPGFLAIEMAKAGCNEIVALDISRTFVDIARKNAEREGVGVKFRQGNASAMFFPSDRFDRIVCRAAFKNFSAPLDALKEMHRVLKPGGKALIIDLRKDTPREAIDTYVDGLNLSLPSRLFTKLTFRMMLLKRAYTAAQFRALAEQSGFSKTTIEENDLGFEAWLEKGTSPSALA
jgi:ubiquinone/menaquinone biosynthesis C-methylase UbiE